MAGTFNWSVIFSPAFWGKYFKKGSFSSLLIWKLVFDPWFYVLLGNLLFINLLIPIALWGGLIDFFYDLFWSDTFSHHMHIPLYALGWYVPERKIP